MFKPDPKPEKRKPKEKMTSYEFRKKYAGKKKSGKGWKKVSDKSGKPKKSRRSKLVEKADKWFSLRVRLEDSNENGYGKCVTCGRVMHAKKAQCGHYHSRKHYSVRWSRMNAHIQCGPCNMSMGDPDVNLQYLDFMQKKYDEEDLIKLRNKKNSSAPVWDIEIEAHVNLNMQLVKGLSKKKGIKPWW